MRTPKVTVNVINEPSTESEGGPELALMFAAERWANLGAALIAIGNNPRKLRQLHKRLMRIRRHLSDAHCNYGPLEDKIQATQAQIRRARGRVL